MLLWCQITIVCRLLPPTAPLLPCTLWGNIASNSVLYDTRTSCSTHCPGSNTRPGKKTACATPASPSFVGFWPQGTEGTRFSAWDLLTFSFADWSSICSPCGPGLLPTASLASVCSEERQGTEHMEILWLHFLHLQRITEKLGYLSFLHSSFEVGWLGAWPQLVSPPLQSQSSQGQAFQHPVT